MSKEAKVGLLLGLVLIVGIVLVLRGLHGNEEVRLDEELAISSPMENPSDSVIQETVDIHSAVTQLSDRSTLVIPAVAKNDSEIRFEGPLLRDHSGQSVQTGGPVIPPATDPLDKLKSLTEPVPSDKSIIEVVPGDTQRAEDPQQKRIYVVEKGDCLEKIALRVYGKVEGKKHKNIVGIFASNKDKMSSMDRVYPGQKLLIPRLPGEPGSVEMATTGQMTPRDMAVSIQSTKQVYLVQKYDTLWDIAEAKLGSGLRYKEIKKLNNLKSDKIGEGQKLRIPK